MNQILDNGEIIIIKDLGECRKCLDKPAADLKILDKGEIIINLVLNWKYTFIIITHSPDIKV